MSFNFLKLSAGRLAIALMICMGTSGYAAHAQSGKFDITGVVTDSSGVAMSGATVVVLTQADSVLTKFAITGGDGDYKLRRVPEGEYILQVTFVGYKVHRHNISLAGAVLDAGTIVLEESLEEIGELLVSSEHVPMVVKRDTLEYNAAAFGTRPNAVVEELLKRLPGIEVGADGSIKAQGEDIGGVLGDGKEFFFALRNKEHF